MEGILAEKLLAVSIGPLRYIHSHPVTSKQWQRFLVAGVFTFISIVMYIFMVIYIVLYPIDIIVLAQIISSFGLITLAELKLLPLTYYNNRIRRILGNRNKFWSVGNDAGLRKVVVELYQVATLSVRTFSAMVIATLILFLARPFYDDVDLLTLMWCPTRYHGTQVLLTVQVIYALYLVVYVISFSGLFMVGITDLRVQFVILNWRIRYHEYTSGPEDIVELRKFVQHHRFLLSIIKDIEKIFMIHLLFLYCLTITSSCVELYATSAIEQPFSAKMRSLIYCAVLLFQLGMFCFPMGELTNEIYLVSQSFYMCNWEESSRLFQTWLPFAIQHTQQAVDFKALGLITINKMALVDVFKSTLSFLTFMRNMK